VHLNILMLCSLSKTFLFASVAQQLQMARLHTPPFATPLSTHKIII
jgi:hypothetical protein